MQFTKFTKFTGAAVLLALIPSALATGSAIVVSNCDFPVYFASVAQSTPAAMALLPPGGFSEAYTLPNVGVSVKLSTSISGEVTQFEFTWDDGNINYDISNINGNPFADFGMALTPSVGTTSAFPSCKTVSCPAGVAPCVEAYNQPDDVRTMVCSDSTSLTMTLCPGGSSKRDVEFKPHSHRLHARHMPARA